MRVVIFSDTYPPEVNGVATSTRNLYRTLKAHGDEVLVVTTNPYNQELAQDGDIVRVKGVKLKSLYDYRMAGIVHHGALKIITEFKPDVAHIQTDFGVGQFGFLTVNRLQLPCVYTFHTMIEDYTYYVTKGHLDRAAKGVVRFYVRNKSRKVDEFITPSEKIKDYMRSIGVDAYLSVIPTGIDFDIFRPQNNDPKVVKELKTKYHLNDGSYIFLSIGRVAKEKSLDICLKGYAEFLKGKPQRKTKFVIVGGGPALDELKLLTKELGIEKNVVFVGPVSPDDVHYYYQLGQCFLSASVTETQGLTFMEAMASGLVLLVRYDNALLETIQDGSNGYFYLDEHDMANKLASVMELPEDKIKELRKQMDIAIEPYSLEKFYQNIHATYQRAIRKNW